MGYERILILWKVPDFLTSVEYNRNSDLKNLVVNSIYPNPSSNLVNIDCSLPLSKFSDIKIFDILGREVTTISAVNSFINENRITFNASNLHNGTYFVRITTDHKSVVQKFTVMK